MFVAAAVLEGSLNVVALGASVLHLRSTLDVEARMLFAAARWASAAGDAPWTRRFRGDGAASDSQRWRLLSAWL